ncbi:unnamed protein product [Merluccius merluccius]
MALRPIRSIPLEGEEEKTGMEPRPPGPDSIAGQSHRSQSTSTAPGGPAAGNYSWRKAKEVTSQSDTQ